MAMGREEPLDHVTNGPGPSGVVKGSDSSCHSEPKKKGFHPLRAVRKIFRRKTKPQTKENDEDKMAALKSRSTSELVVSDDDQRNRGNGNSSHLGSGLSMSHDSVFSPEHNDSNDMRTAQSIQNIAMQKELLERLRPHRDSDEDDVGLPHSPCTSPTTAEVLCQGLRETSGKSRSTCSDGSLLSMGSSENDEDSFGLPSSRQSSKLSLDRRTDSDMDQEESVPLSHKAAHHKIAIRPKRTRAVGRHRKLQQLTVASLPATPEDIEETRSASPDRSWPLVEAVGSSGSISRASSALSTSDSTGSLSAGPSPTRLKVLPTPSDGAEMFSGFSSRSKSSAAERKLKHEVAQHSRRRTVSESPSRDLDTKHKDSIKDGEVRESRAHSASLLEMKDSYLPSPTCSEPLQDSFHSSPFSQFSRDNSAQQIPSHGSGSPIRLNVSEIYPRSPVPTHKNFDSVQDQGAKPKESGKAQLQRDPSYRAAIHQGSSWESSDSSDRIKKEKEDSRGIFSFGSRFRKDPENIVKEKEKSKEKKEEKKDIKEKKDDKENESPFFSRLWGSRRNSKKRKDKKEDESDKENKSDDAELSKINKPIDEGLRSSVDVKAMVQSITSRNSQTSMPAKRFEKESPYEMKNCNAKHSINGTTGKEQKLKAESTHYSKSLESLSGPRSLELTAAPETDTQRSNRTRLSGSMPRLDSESKQKQTLASMIAEDGNDNSGVIVIEGEVVRLRKKLSSGEDRKLHSTSLAIEKTSNIENEHRKEKRGSFLSFYSRKDDSKNKSEPSRESKIINRPRSGLFSDSQRKSAESENSDYLDRISKKLDHSTTDEVSKISSFLNRTSSKSASEANRKSGSTIRDLSTEKSRFDSTSSMSSEAELRRVSLTLIRDPSPEKLRKPESPGKQQTRDLRNFTPIRDSSPEKYKDLANDSPTILRMQEAESHKYSEKSPKTSESPTIQSSSKVELRRISLTPVRDLSPEKTTKSSEVPEFMRIQLNRVKTPEMQRVDSKEGVSRMRSKSQADELPALKERRRFSGGVQDQLESISSVVSLEKTPTKVEVTQTKVQRKASFGDSQKVVKEPDSNIKINSQSQSLENSPFSSSQSIRNSFQSRCPQKPGANEKAPEKSESFKAVEQQPSKLQRAVVKTSSKNEEGNFELLKVFHRRSLKLKDHETSSKEDKTITADQTTSKREYLETEIGPSSDAERGGSSPSPSPKEPLSGKNSSRSSVSSVECDHSRRSSLENKRALSSQESSRPKPPSSLTTALSTPASVEIVSRTSEKADGSVPEWRKIAQQRREQRELRERQHVTSSSHMESSLILQHQQTPPKISSKSSKVLDMVSNFQKLQVS